MIWLLVLVMTSISWAAPSVIEVWFLSAPKTSYLESILKEKTRSTKVAQNLQCQQMGDYCFDPQFGLYKPGDTNLEEKVDAEIAAKDAIGTNIAPAKSIDRNLIDCDKNNYFDIFCGKAKAVEADKASSFEIWIDTSSSMREMDYTDKEGGCYRKSMMKRLDDAGCGFNNKVNVMMFDISMKQAGAMDSLCLNIGLNDYKKMIDFIERSTAKKLIIITDIYEFHKEYADYLESKDAIIKGDKGDLTAKDLLEQVDHLAKLCK